MHSVLTVSDSQTHNHWQRLPTWDSCVSRPGLTLPVEAPFKEGDLGSCPLPGSPRVILPPGFVSSNVSQSVFRCDLGQVHFSELVPLLIYGNDPCLIRVELNEVMYAKVLGEWYLLRGGSGVQ